ncbi:MAG: 50S ribosomal protein L29 [Sedimentisphaerales bacterium]|nr:50S ribosomal protein L29 [Sedimentisphaerales bacterium]
MKATDIREMNPDELEEELESLERRLFEIRTQAVTEKLEDPSRLKKAKRDIARIKTVIRERQLAHAKEKAAE